MAYLWHLHVITNIKWKWENSGRQFDNTYQNLNAYSISFNLFQANLANELNTAQSVISAYENGKTRILTAFAYEIVKKYGVSLDWLCGRID